MERTAKTVRAFQYHKFFVDPKVNNLRYFLLLCVSWKHLIRSGWWLGFIFVTSEPRHYLTYIRMDTGSLYPELSQHFHVHTVSRLRMHGAFPPILSTFID